MNLHTKSFLFAIIILAATASTAYILTLLDQIVHGTLYEYNLRFDLAWANPYWNLLRFAQILLGVIGVSTVVYTMFTVRSYLHTSMPKEKAMQSQKPVVITPTSTLITPKPAAAFAEPSTTQPTASPPATTQLPQPAPLLSRVHAPTPTPVLIPSASSGYIRCLHCGKVFTQPLRMLDFQGDRPRIINICPFCNEIIQSTPRQEEKEQNKRLRFKKKNVDQTTKTLFSEATSELQ